jgi:hypothetical protein
MIKKLVDFFRQGLRSMKAAELGSDKMEEFELSHAIYAEIIVNASKS